MLKLRKQTFKKLGLPQGTLIHVGEKYTEDVKIFVTQYTEKYSRKNKIKDISECKGLEEESLIWIKVIGVHDPKIIKKIGQTFGISDLTLEEIMNTNKHPKIESFQDYLFVIARTYYYEIENQVANFENLSIFIGKNLIITFQEKENELFKAIDDRVNDSTSLLRKKGLDYLFCSIMDSIVDSYFVALDHIGNKIESIETSIVSESNEKILHDIYHLRQEVMIFSKILRPEREIMNHILHEKRNWISEETIPYFHDVYEHIIHMIETLDSYRENTTGLHELYLSKLSNKMNEVMKTLTIIASLFIPITFVAGVYGMNFQYMPELNSPFGYPIVLAAMVITFTSLVYYFKRKKWL